MNFQNTQQLTDDIQNESSESLNNSEIIDSQPLQQLTDDIQNESSESLNNVESSVVRQNDAISEENALNVQLKLKLKEVCWMQNGQEVCKP
ncbi:hypothetical protein NSTC745_00645 [Nostoc sp. DSM 114161]|jgi:hypothetical protein|uniref:hypothetical protein n=1 Tax=Nostoc sp. DSM 114161 TaxID=3440143 RepID=UPI0040459AEA